jgi:undecaprenyl-diphosphatase
MNDLVEDRLTTLAGRWPLLDSVMKLTATDLILVIGLALLLLWFWPGADATRARNQRIALAAGCSALAALALGQVIGALFPEARPFVADPSARLLIPHAPDNGLPSDHALASFGVAGTLLWRRRGLGVALVLAGVWIGLARVYVGVHWPGDIAAGAAVGLLTGALAARTVDWWSRPQRWASRFLPSLLLARP